MTCTTDSRLIKKFQTRRFSSAAPDPPTDFSTSHTISLVDSRGEGCRLTYATLLITFAILYLVSPKLNWHHQKDQSTQIELIGGQLDFFIQGHSREKQCSVHSQLEIPRLTPRYLSALQLVSDAFKTANISSALITFVPCRTSRNGRSDKSYSL
ncbi:hypothetical protein L873DRAFT_1802900 [Choiromyces venosus 120613-1]|uniref:Uncharacterized protein n=1 Tax=Choiromyces venosus 120613-1 TaxID=1336337 RepID=A0A3N4K0U2_9PEZI|nr:hypothetical protein L873DRAFT_1802900 [Choiromyces venosus 120613-1]